MIRSMNMKAGVTLCILCLFGVVGCSDRYTSYQTGDDGALHINEYKIVVKTIPSFDFVHVESRIESNVLKEKAKPLAKRVFIAANMQGVEVMGPLTMTFGDLRYLGGGPLEVGIGFPSKGEFLPVNGVALGVLPGFTCLTVSLPVDVLDIETYWKALIHATYRFDYKPSGQFRSVLKFNETNTGYLIELQVGV